MPREKLTTLWGQRLSRLIDPEGLYFLSYGLFLITSLLSTSFYYRYFIGSPYTWLQVACLAMLLLREYRLRGGSQNWIALTVLGLLGVLSLWTTMGNLTRLVPLMFFYIYSARNIHFDRIARFSLKISSWVVSLVILSGYLGIIDNVVVAKGLRVREYLGFRYALYLPGILLNMTSLWLYLNRRRVPLVGGQYLCVPAYQFPDLLCHCADAVGSGAAASFFAGWQAAPALGTVQWFLRAVCRLFLCVYCHL